jgi:AcrR family transcriptional regulator
MTDRKREILQEAVNIIVTRGHAGLTMRAVARASGLKLGALQYHYPTRIDLVRALAEWVAEQTALNFEAYLQQENTDERSLHAMVDFLIEDPLNHAIDLNTLFEQLWAMALVEPVIRALLDEMYGAYLAFVEQQLSEMGVDDPRPDALVIMSMLEGLSPFVGPGRRWHEHAESCVASIHAFLDARYEKPAKR